MFCSLLEPEGNTVGIFNRLEQVFLRQNTLITCDKTVVLELLYELEYVC